MTKVTIQLKDNDYQHLIKVANYVGKSIQELLQEWISQLPEVDEDYDVTGDPVFQMEGYESDAPSDLSINIDNYLYGEDYPK